MLRRDAAVDDADDDAFPVQPARAAQAHLAFKQAKKPGAEIRGQRPDLVLPHLQHLGLVLEFQRLGGGHGGREAVQAVAIAVDLLRPRPQPRQNPVLLLHELRGIALDAGRVPVEGGRRRLS